LTGEDQRLVSFKNLDSTSGSEKDSSVSAENLDDEKLKSSLETKAGYKWKKLPSSGASKKVCLGNKEKCDLCKDFEQDKMKSFDDKMVFVEPGCNHNLHRNCRGKMGRAIWDWGGCHFGYSFNSCPLCYFENEYTENLKK